MKVRILELDGYNTGALRIKKECRNPKSLCAKVKITGGRFYRCDTSSPLVGRVDRYYYRNHSLKYKRKIIYGFNEFGIIEDGTLIFVGFNWFQHQRFLWMQREHWFQRESNLRYVVNIIFLIIGAYLGFKGIS